eukprot:CAMPEP_0184479032 /NCGR_PEP_ID=MMETSP0113_2-20130426/893_1 /TAXON_ID=91329 /ORGANISM="Norrisiella sphaerica, Strain BC52" /LENGTH=114 /DNA_ID=CAMNT_0026857011 /DNA_START=55 /DNA_END=399 /DNA_ORIENTATION=+
MGGSNSKGSSLSVDTLIKENKVVVFSASWCPYCKKAKGLLQSLDAKMKIIETDQDPNGDEYKLQLKQKTGRSSVPQIFVQGKFIGGCNDGPGVVPLHQQGKLVPMLKEAGAIKT